MAKKTKLALPKRIAGVKVPKRLRKSGRKFAGMLGTPLGRAVVAEALVAAAGAAAVALKRHAPAGDDVRDLGAAAAEGTSRTVATARDVARAALGAVGTVVADAARQALSPSPPSGDARREDRPPGEERAADEAARRTPPREKPSRH